MSTTCGSRQPDATARSIAAVNTTRIYRYVTKPWESEDLRMALRRAIEAFHLGRENQRLVEDRAMALLKRPELVRAREIAPLGLT